MSRRLAGLIVPLVVLVVWQLVSSAGIYSVNQLPPPLDVVTAAGELIGRGELWHHIAISTQRVLIGFVIGSVIAIVLGGVVGLSETVSTLLTPTIQAVRAVPASFRHQIRPPGP